jgi:hypothetical protein
MQKFTKTQFREWGRQGGLKGGSKGGKQSAANLTPQQRTDRARMAAQARYNKPGTSRPYPTPLKPLKSL